MSTLVNGNMETKDELDESNEPPHSSWLLVTAIASSSLLLLTRFNKGSTISFASVNTYQSAFFASVIVLLTLLTQTQQLSLTVEVFASTRNAFDWYTKILESNPVITKSVTTALIQFLGDYFAQSYEAFQMSSQQKTLGLLCNPFQSFDYNLRRGASLAMDGLLLSGPLLHYAFELMEKILPTENGSSYAAFIHVLANDYLVDSTYLLISFFFVAIVEGHAHELSTLFRKDFLATLQASWGTSVLLIPIEFLCFSKLPVSWRVLSMNFIDILWGAIISFVAHRSRRDVKSDIAGKESS